MSLVELIGELKPLVESDAPDVGAIGALLRARDELAEYEVARAWVRRRLSTREIDALLEGDDPEDRRAAVELVELTSDARSAAQRLRPRVRDANAGVRSSARRAVRRLGLDEVALPARETPARWDPSGWSTGLVMHATRPENLAVFGLPELATRSAVCELLEVQQDDLRRLMRPGDEPGSAWITFEIEKARGGSRRICAPRAPLREVQRKILRAILDKVPAHDACHGFVRGRSVVTNAAPHAGAALILKLNLKDFFPTVHYRRVSGLFRALGYGHDVASTLAGLTTWRARTSRGVAWPGVLPQGAPSSPAIANLVCRHLDARLVGLAEKVGARYTRYADDLTFSFADKPSIPVGRLAWWVDQICGQEGFAENTKKRRTLRPSGRQMVTGVVVNERPTLPRDARRSFRAILHNCEKNGVGHEARGRDDFPAWLRGYAAWAQMVQPELGQRWMAEVERLLRERP